jgi:hypothetical protein
MIQNRSKINGPYLCFRVRPGRRIAQTKSATVKSKGLVQNIDAWFSVHIKKLARRALAGLHLLSSFSAGDGAPRLSIAGEGMLTNGCLRTKAVNLRPIVYRSSTASVRQCAFPTDRRAHRNQRSPADKLVQCLHHLNYKCRKRINPEQGQLLNVRLAPSSHALASFRAPWRSGMHRVRHYDARHF